MRIGYFVHWTGGPGTGVFYKVVAHVSEWIRLGHQVSLAVLSANRNDEAWRSSLPPQADFRSIAYFSRSQRFLAPRLLWRWLQEQSPDLIYFRGDSWAPGITRVMRRVPTIVEVNSDDSAEAVLRPGLRPRLRRGLRGRILDNAVGVVYVTSELSDSVAFSGVRCPSCVIPNGIDLDAVRVVAPEHSSGVRLLLLATAGQSWQGIDLLPPVLDVRPSWEIDVAGIASHDASGVAHPRLRMHGQLRREGVMSLAAKAHAGLGTLALYRKGLHESSSLKHREYLAMGLPVILGCSDPDIPPGANWALRVDNSPDGLLKEAGPVEAFARSWTGRRVPRGNVMQIGTVAKEAARISFFRRLLDEGWGNP